MPVWYAIPTANADKCGGTFAKWRAMGYRTAALVDGDTPVPANCDLYIRAANYKGYAASVNLLLSLVAEMHNPDWLVWGGDDVYPDPNKTAEEIARECTEHFNGTFGVMQPVGDVYGAIFNVCPSPWCGRDWRRRMYGGKGPLFMGYVHYFEDEEHKLVAEKLGRLWQRHDLSQYHDHWQRDGSTDVPAHLVKAQAIWPQSHATFKARKAAGFPGHEPLPE